MVEENKEYVLPIRCGGCGNAMFQVIAGEIYAMMNNKICLITRETQNPHNLFHQEYAKTVFKKTKFIDTEGIPFEKFTFFPQVIGFEEWKPWHIPGNVVLRGYFQTVSFLQEHKDFVVQYFYDGLREFLLPPTQKVGLHVRRGDYVGNSFHDTVSDKYYRKALLLFEDMVKECGVSVFSDDINFCRNQNFLKKIPNVEFIEELDELKTMGIMISCQGGFICANSSFSWWGAFLGAHQKGEIVTVPSKWCLNKDTKDLNLIPREWVIVNT